jgi:hypothetical protein
MKKEDFEKAIADLKNELPTATGNEIMAALIKITAIVKDGHTDIAPKTRYYPLRFGY